MKRVSILAQPSWAIGSSHVYAALTCQGGHLGPVSFRIGQHGLAPGAVAPWATEKISKEIPVMLRVLRGDFFCMPFGGNETPWKKERHPLHGETANEKWVRVSSETHKEGSFLHVRMQTAVRKGHVDKLIILKAGHSAVYCQHLVRGMLGPMNFGHHAMLKFPAYEGSGRVSMSPFIYGQVFPGMFENPAEGGYTSLLAGAEFEKLDAVPLERGGFADLSRYPARRGFEDLVQVAADPQSQLSWTAVTFPRDRCVWFSLKDPRVLTSTILWHSNGGRHYPPWNGRHRNVLGLEEVTSYFHTGLAESAAKNPLNERGIPTSAILTPKRPLIVNFIMAMAGIPAGFDIVKTVLPEENSVTVVSASGKSVSVPLQTDFIYSPSLVG
ncbi:MAG: hypothetical protein C5B47_02930 [Verrucomicrobia bacterium]|nr:MAG: hypothetical protein C5B47_02930 [Verrucomicrobiota bacterium]